MSRIRVFSAICKGTAVLSDICLPNLDIRDAQEEIGVFRRHCQSQLLIEPESHHHLRIGVILACFSILFCFRTRDLLCLKAKELHEYLASESKYWAIS
jgi:hypothetical protein